MSTTFNSKSLGIVMQMEQKRYSDLEEENMERHFLNKKETIVLGFLEELHRKGVGRKNEIEESVIAALKAHQPIENPNLDELIEADKWARNFVLERNGVK